MSTTLCKKRVITKSFSLKLEEKCEILNLRDKIESRRVCNDSNRNQKK